MPWLRHWRLYLSEVPSSAWPPSLLDCTVSLKEAELVCGTIRCVYRPPPYYFLQAVEFTFWPSLPTENLEKTKSFIKIAMADKRKRNANQMPPTEPNPFPTSSKICCYYYPLSWARTILIEEVRMNVDSLSNLSSSMKCNIIKELKYLSSIEIHAAASYSSCGRKRSATFDRDESARACGLH